MSKNNKHRVQRLKPSLNQNFQNVDSQKQYIKLLRFTCSLPPRLSAFLWRPWREQLRAPRRVWWSVLSLWYSLSQTQPPMFPLSCGVFAAFLCITQAAENMRGRHSRELHPSPFLISRDVSFKVKRVMFLHAFLEWYARLRSVEMGTEQSEKGFWDVNSKSAMKWAHNNTKIRLSKAEIFWTGWRMFLY